MTAEQIEKFFDSEKSFNSLVKISFKTRNTMEGMFIKMPNFDDLKSKNFWLIVREPNIDSWKKTKDTNLFRMFNGAEFTKLSYSKS